MDHFLQIHNPESTAPGVPTTNLHIPTQTARLHLRPRALFISTSPPPILPMTHPHASPKMKPTTFHGGGTLIRSRSRCEWLGGDAYCVQTAMKLRFANMALLAPNFSQPLKGPLPAPAYKSGMDGKTRTRMRMRIDVADVAVRKSNKRVSRV